MSRHKIVNNMIKHGDFGMDIDAFNEEYQDICNQCGRKATGYDDPSSNIFYCNDCWWYFNNPNQSQTNNTNNNAINNNNNNNNNNSTNNSPNKKKRKKRKKNTPNSGTNTANNTPAKSVGVSTNNVKQQNNSASKPKPVSTGNSNNNINNNNSNNSNNSNNNRKVSKPKSGGGIFSNRASLFDDRPSLFGDNNSKPKASKFTGPKNVELFDEDVDPNTVNTRDENSFFGYDDSIKPTPNETKTNNNDNIPEIKAEPIIQLKSKKNKQQNNDRIRTATKGMKIESQKSYEKRKKLKESMIYKRFGITNINGNKVKYERKPHINLCIIGHVDAGKSTMMGHLLYKYGNIDKKLMHKYTKESNERGKGSFKYAWVLDCHDEERERGITVDVSTNYFETENRCITILDNPGHKDFIPNMITGVAQADTAILVVNSNINEFENDFSDKGQTKEHALIAKSLGINQIIIAVNKMDKINWDKNRFEMIKAMILKFLKKIGFKSKNILWCPVSGLTGINLIPKEMTKIKDKNSNNNDNNIWYKKDYKTLIEIIDTLKPNANIKDAFNDLRMTYVFHVINTI